MDLQAGELHLGSRNAGESTQTAQQQGEKPQEEQARVIKQTVLKIV